MLAGDSKNSKKLAGDPLDIIAGAAVVGVNAPLAGAYYLSYYAGVDSDRLSGSPAEEDMQAVATVGQASISKRTTWLLTSTSALAVRKLSSTSEAVAPALNRACPCSACCTDQIESTRSLVVGAFSSTA